MIAGYLLDAHVLLWSLYESQKLKRSHRAALNSETQTFVSAASVWEVEIKKRSGALPVPDAIWDQCANAGYHFLSIDSAHARAAGALPLHHRDPFDRMLIAQAQVEGLTLLTSDTAFSAYDVALA